ncbi:MAG: trypsin-like peptidase domain-containing protein [Clostridia bacterium]|nr:trypsin-like peptidase domain-containing protein [Clostridia bacterium]
MKKVVSVVLILALMLSFSVTIYAQDVSVYLNGEKLDFDVPAKIINGRTMVPMRKIFESLGAVVSWDAPSQTATGKKDGTVVNLTIDSKTMFINGEPKVLDVGPMLIDSRTLVPVRAVAESFDCKVDWDESTQSVKITTGADFVNKKQVLAASEIADKVSPSVFYIEVYDAAGYATASGSGFFVSADGVAVTNYHVIEDTSSAIITTIDGNKFKVNSIIAYDEDMDIAIIRVDKTTVYGGAVSGFSAAKMGDSDNIKAGQTIYALGSPVGLQNTISNGIISNIGQVIEGNKFIQITAPISHGSSGGALVDEYGEVLGITSAGIEDAENIGFAIPINVLKLFELDAQGMSYLEFASGNSSFTLEISTQTIELAVGETKEVYVYADGKGDDWSINWYTNQEYIVSCAWGDWLQDGSSVCPLKLTGVRPGTATVTVYSDVDFQGKDITVVVKNSYGQVYPGSVVPTYTSITGVPIASTKNFDTSICYIYYYHNVDVVQSYVDYLLANGFTYYNKEIDRDTSAYYYIAPNGKVISVVLAHSWNQVWIYVSK